ncbi:MAG: cysteine peptidase family C39 domain-containing protein [Fimbriimonas sp.]|nr:cysteine peptidase family C39 domain-containing protein [Fimbriimonas sp.]
MRERLLAEMRIWPSRFENIQMVLGSQGGRYRVTLAPDLSRVDQLTPTGIETKVVYQDGESWRRVEANGNGDEWLRSRGSEWRTRILGDKASIEDTSLLPMGVAIGGYSLAEAAARDPHLTVRRSGTTLVASDFALNQDGIPVYVSLTWDEAHHAPLLIKTHDNKNGKYHAWVQIDLSHLDAQRLKGYVDVSNLGDRSGRYTLISLTPLTRRPQRFALAQGTPFVDEALGVETYVGKESPINEDTAAKVLASAKSSKALDPKGHFFSTSCGPDSLFYYLRLAGANVNDSTVRKSFPTIEYGVTMKQIETVAAKYGHRMRAVKATRLRDISTPAILSVRDSHFVVLVSLKGRVATVVDPPFVVTTGAATDLAQKWTGYALIGGE